MVHFSVKPSLVAFLVLVILLFDATSYATNVEQIHAICNLTTNPSFCSNILNSKPGGAADADLVTLAQYTIDILRANVTNTIKLIKSLITNASDPNAKAHYKRCFNYFSLDEGPYGNVERAEQMLKTGVFGSVGSAASGVAATVQYCVSGDIPGEPPFYDPSSLPKYADFVEQVAEILCVMSDYLTLKHN